MLAALCSFIGSLEMGSTGNFFPYLWLVSGSTEITFKKLLLCDFLSCSATSVAIVALHQSLLRTAGARTQCSEDGLLAKDQFDALQFHLFS